MTSPGTSGQFHFETDIEAVREQIERNLAAIQQALGRGFAGGTGGGDAVERLSRELQDIYKAAGEGQQKLARDFRAAQDEARRTGQAMVNPGTGQSFGKQSNDSNAAAIKRASQAYGEALGNLPADAMADLPAFRRGIASSLKAYGQALESTTDDARRVVSEGYDPKQRGSRIGPRTEPLSGRAAAAAYNQNPVDPIDAALNRAKTQQASNAATQTQASNAATRAAQSTANSATQDAADAAADAAKRKKQRADRLKRRQQLIDREAGGDLQMINEQYSVSTSGDFYNRTGNNAGKKIKDPIEQDKARRQYQKQVDDAREELRRQKAQDQIAQREQQLTGRQDPLTGRQQTRYEQVNDRYTYDTKKDRFVYRAGALVGRNVADPLLIDQARRQQQQNTGPEQDAAFERQRQQMQSEVAAQTQRTLIAEEGLRGDFQFEDDKQRQHARIVRAMEQFPELQTQRTVHVGGQALNVDYNADAAQTKVTNQAGADLERSSEDYAQALRQAREQLLAETRLREAASQGIRTTRNQGPYQVNTLAGEVTNRASGERLDQQTTQYVQAMRQATDAVLKEAAAAEKSALADQERATATSQSATQSFLGGLTSRGFGGGSGGFDLQGLATSAGTAVKYTVLYRALGDVTQALGDLQKENFNFIDSQTAFNAAVGKGQEVTQDYLNTLQKYSAQAGQNVGDALDSARRGAAAYSGAGGPQRQDGADFEKSASQLAVITGKQLEDVTGDLIAVSGAYGVAADQVERINDAVVNAAKGTGQTSGEISQGLANLAAAAKTAGFTYAEAANQIGVVSAGLDETGATAATRLTKIYQIIGGSEGKNAIAQFNNALNDPSKAISVKGTVAETLPQIVDAYKNGGASESAKQQLRNSLAGTANGREFDLLIDNQNRLLDLNAKSLQNAGASLRTYQDILNDITGTMRNIRGELSNLAVNLGSTGAFDALYVAAKAALAVLQGVNTVLGQFDSVSPKIRGVGFAVLEVVAAYRLLAKVSRTAAEASAPNVLLRGAGRVGQLVSAPLGVAQRTPIVGGAFGRVVGGPGGIRSGEQIGRTRTDSSTAQATAGIETPAIRRLADAEQALVRAEYELENVQKESARALRGANNEVLKAQNAYRDAEVRAAQAANEGATAAAEAAANLEEAAGALAAAVKTQEEVRLAQANLISGAARGVRNAQTERDVASEPAANSARNASRARRGLDNDVKQAADAEAKTIRDRTAAMEEANAGVREAAGKSQAEQEAAAAKRAEVEAKYDKIVEDAAVKRGEAEAKANAAAAEGGLNTSGRRMFGTTVGGLTTIGIGATLAYSLEKATIEANSKITDAVAKARDTAITETSGSGTKDDLAKTASDLRQSAADARSSSSGLLGSISNFFRGNPTGAVSKDNVARADAYQQAADAVGKLEDTAGRSSNINDVASTIDLSSGDSLDRTLKALSDGGRSATTVFQALQGALQNASDAAKGLAGAVGGNKAAQYGQAAGADIAGNIGELKTRLGDDLSHNKNFFGNPNKQGQKDESDIGILNDINLPKVQSAVAKTISDFTAANGGTLPTDKDSRDKLNGLIQQAVRGQLDYTIDGKTYNEFDQLTTGSQQGLISAVTEGQYSAGQNIDGTDIFGGSNAPGSETDEDTRGNNGAAVAQNQKIDRSAAIEAAKAGVTDIPGAAAEAGVNAALGLGTAQQNSDGQQLTTAKVQAQGLHDTYNKLKALGVQDPELEQLVAAMNAADVAANQAAVSHEQALGQLAEAMVSPFDKAGQLQAELDSVNKQIALAGNDTDMLNALNAQKQAIANAIKDNNEASGFSDTTTADFKQYGTQDSRANALRTLNQANAHRDRLVNDQGATGADKGKAIQDAIAAQEAYDKVLSDTTLAKEAADAVPGSAISAAQLQIDTATAALKIIKDHDTPEYYNALAQQIAGQKGLADAMAEDAKNIELLSGDMTDPVFKAKADLDAATAKLKADIGKYGENPTDPGAAALIRTDRVGQANAQAGNDAAAETQYEQNLANQNKLGQISHAAYLGAIKQRRDLLQSELDGMTKGTQEYQQISDQITNLSLILKQGADSMNGAFNIGDVKTPTLYQVRRFIADSAQSIKTGLTNAANDPILKTTTPLAKLQSQVDQLQTTNAVTSLQVLQQAINGLTTGTPITSAPTPTTATTTTTATTGLGTISDAVALAYAQRNLEAARAQGANTPQYYEALNQLRSAQTTSAGTGSAAGNVVTIQINGGDLAAIKSVMSTYLGPQAFGTTSTTSIRKV